VPAAERAHDPAPVLVVANWVKAVLIEITNHSSSVGAWDFSVV
jgi:hypothetical protein